MKIGKINRQSIGISGFTSVLSNYEGMPNQLYVAGSLPASRPPSVAIIGSRKPTPYGKEVTHKLAYELAQRGVIIVSGLAYGIDAIAHEAALEAGGTTIAIMANGLHRIYPAAHQNLAERIVKRGGAIISEQDLGVDAHKYHFLARNRIVSGLADAVVVTEATNKSGTFSTIAHAIMQNKEVFAVPGPITSLLSAGPNRLLQEGARIAITAQDILDVIAPELEATQSQLPIGDTPEQALILKALSAGPLDTTQLTYTLQTQVEKLLQTLTLMELNGVIKATAGRWSIRS